MRLAEVERQRRAATSRAVAAIDELPALIAKVLDIEAEEARIANVSASLAST